MDRRLMAMRVSVRVRPLTVLLVAAVHWQCAASHGTLTKPISRALRFASNGSTAGEPLSGNCARGACEWYQQATVCPGATTNCDPMYRTMGVHCGSVAPVDYPCTPGHQVPWCAPGTAPVTSPCGVFAGAGPLLPDGRDMLDLDGPASETWEAGKSYSVAWSMIANHGGGYAYRLASKTGPQTEEAFQAGHLNFVGANTSIVDEAGAVVATFPAVRLSSGTHPPGSTWARNPIPLEEGMIPPIPGVPQLAGRGPFPFSNVDEVQVPADLPSGDYILSWRWDAEQTKQVWSQCADVRVVNPREENGMVSGRPLVAAARSTKRPLCVGASLGLTMDECTAWVELYDSLNGPKWVGTNDTRLNAARTDPCGAKWTDWKKSIVCTRQRDLVHISEVYLMGVPLLSGAVSNNRDVRGRLPASIGQLSHLTALSIVNSGITGMLPPELGTIAGLKMIWLDHNPSLGGTIPLTFNQLNLTVLELHYSNFSGALPPLNYLAIPDCTMYNDRWASIANQARENHGGNVFDCPLPHGAESCGAVCT